MENPSKCNKYDCPSVDELRCSEGMVDKECPVLSKDYDVEGESDQLPCHLVGPQQSGDNNLTIDASIEPYDERGLDFKDLSISSSPSQREDCTQSSDAVYCDEADLSLSLRQTQRHDAATLQKVVSRVEKLEDNVEFIRNMYRRDLKNVVSTLGSALADGRKKIYTSTGKEETKQYASCCRKCHFCRGGVSDSSEVEGGILCRCKCTDVSMSLRSIDKRRRRGARQRSARGKPTLGEARCLRRLR